MIWTQVSNSPYQESVRMTKKKMKKKNKCLKLETKKLVNRCPRSQLMSAKYATYQIGQKNA